MVGNRKNHFVWEQSAKITFGRILPGRRFVSSGSGDVQELPDFLGEDNGDEEEDIFGNMSRLRCTHILIRNKTSLRIHFRVCGCAAQ